MICSFCHSIKCEHFDQLLLPDVPKYFPKKGERQAFSMTILTIRTSNTDMSYCYTREPSLTVTFHIIRCDNTLHLLIYSLLMKVEM